MPKDKKKVSAKPMKNDYSSKTSQPKDEESQIPKGKTKKKKK